MNTRDDCELGMMATLPCDKAGWFNGTKQLWIASLSCVSLAGAAIVCVVGPSAVAGFFLVEGVEAQGIAFLWHGLRWRRIAVAAAAAGAATCGVKKTIELANKWADISDVKRENDELRAVNKELQDKIKVLTKEKTLLTDQVQTLQTKVQKFQEQNNRLQGQVDTLEGKVEELQRLMAGVFVVLGETENT